jgi:hypothetical protein
VPGIAIGEPLKGLWAEAEDVIPVEELDSGTLVEDDG